MIFKGKHRDPSRRGGILPRAMRCAANMILFVLFILQVVWLWLFISGKTLPVPEFLKNYAYDYADKNGFFLKTEEAHISLEGTVVLNGVSVGFAGDTSAIFEARRIEAGIALGKLFKGIIEPKKISVKNARIRSSEGNNKKDAADEINLVLIRRSGNFIFSRASARIGKLRIRGGAKISDISEVAAAASKLGLDEKNQDNEKTYRQTWDSLCNRLMQAGLLFEEFENPAVEIQIDAQKNLPFVNATFLADKYSHASEKFAVEIIEPRADLKIESAKEPTKASARIRAEKVILPIKDETFTVGGTDFHANISWNPQSPLEDSLEARKASFTAREIKTSHGRVSDITALKDSFSAKNISDGIQLFFRHGRGTWQADISGSQDSINLKFSALADVNAILKNPFFTKIDELKGTEFKEPMTIMGSADIEFKQSVRNLRVRIDTQIFSQDCSFLYIPIEEMSACLEFDTDSMEFKANNALIKTFDGWSIGGDVYQNLSDKRYSFALRGNLVPMSIKRIMAPWWTRIFKRIDFLGDKPYADVFVEGRWGEPEYIWCFANVNAVKARYNGSLFEKFSTYVLVNPRLIALLDAKIENGDSRAKFDLQWLYADKGITHFKNTTLSGNFDLTQNEIISLAGEEVEEVFKVVSFAGRPSANVNALLFNPIDKNAESDIYQVRINSHGKMCLDAMDFENTSFDAYSTGGFICAKNIEARICNGEVFGEVKIDNLYDRKNATLDLSLNCQNMDMGEFLDTLSDIGKSPEQILQEDAQEAKDRLNKQNIKGARGAFQGAEDAKLSGNMKISGALFDTEKLKGTGTAEVLSPKLGELNLLGAISRTLNRFGAGIGTFDITKATANCSVADGSVIFDNLLITGPKIKISGLANYEFIKGDIKAKLLVSPFGSLETPVLSRIISVMDPFMNVFEVNLKGKIEDPDIGVSLRPLNIFNSEEKLMESFEKDISTKEKSEAKDIGSSTPDKQDDSIENP